MFHGRGPLVDVGLDLLLHLLFELPADLLPMINAHLNDLKSVLDEATLDSCVNVGVSSKRRRVVHLEHPRLQLLIEHDVEAKQLKANVRLLCLAAPVDVLQLRLHCDDCLYDNGLNFVPDLSCRFGHSRTTFLDRWLRHDAFEAVIKSQLVLIVVKLVILLVQ